MIRRVYRGHNLFWLCTALHCCISKFSAHYVFSLFVPGTHLVGMVGEIGYKEQKRAASVFIPSTPEQQPDNSSQPNWSHAYLDYCAIKGHF